MSKPLAISLVIPVYNEESHLAACLRAIAKQRTMPHEVIVVDNNSTDRSMAIAKQYDFVKIIHEPQQGRIFAQIKGFAAATGNVLARIDTDTRLDPDWTQRIAANLQHADAVTGRALFYDAPLPALSSWLQVVLYQYFQRVVAGTFVLWGTNMALTREAWSKVAATMPCPSGLDEDIVLSLLLRERQVSIVYDNNLVVGASLRRGQVGLIDTVRYLSTWPRDYWYVGRYVSGTIISCITLLIIIVTAPVTILAQIMQSIKRSIT